MLTAATSLRVLPSGMGTVQRSGEGLRSGEGEKSGEGLGSGDGEKSGEGLAAGEGEGEAGLLPGPPPQPSI